MILCFACDSNQKTMRHKISLFGFLWKNTTPLKIDMESIHNKFFQDVPKKFILRNELGRKTKHP